MASVVRLDLARDEDLERWQAFVLRHPDTRYADQGQWRRIFAELYGMRSVDLLCVEHGETLGAASLYLVESPFFGRLLVTCPFFGAGGLYADSDATRSALLDAVVTAARELRVDFVELRSRQACAPGFVVQHEFLDFDLRLEGCERSVWEDRLSSNVRQNVRKSERLPLVFSTTRDPAAPFRLISTTIRDLGSPFHPRRLFELMRKHLGDDVLFSQVHLEERLVAAGVLVRFRDRLATPFIGSLKRFRHTRANYCQYWGIVRHCLDNGIRTFELGRSPRGSSHQRFKEKWGAVPVELYYGHRAVSEGRSYRTVLEPGRLERMASRTWTHLPLAITQALGPRVVRYIP